MPSSLASSTSETARLTSAMSSRVTPCVAVDDDPDDAAPAGRGDDQLLQVVAGAVDDGLDPAGQPCGGGVGLVGAAGAGHCFLLQARAAARCGAHAPSAPAPSGLRRWSGPGRGEVVRLPPGRRRRDRAPEADRDPAWDARGARGGRGRAGRRGDAPGRHVRPRAVRAARMVAMSSTPALRPPGLLPAHPARGLRGRAGAAGRRLLLAAGRRAGEGDQRAGRRARRAGRGAGDAGGRVRRGGRRRPRAGRGGGRAGRARPSEQLDRLRAAAPGRRRSSASVVGRAAPRGPDAAGLAARPGGRRRRPRTPRPAWTSRAPGRRCSDRSPRVCAARTEDWRDRRWLTTRRRRRPRRGHGERGPGRGPGRRARRGLGLRRRRAPPSATTPGRRRRTPRRPTATSATRSARCSPSRKADVVDAEGALRAAVPGAVRGRRRRARRVVLEDGVAAAWVRVLDQAAERSTRELAVGALERRRGPGRGLARRRRADAGHHAPFPGLPEQ